MAAGQTAGPLGEASRRAGRRPESQDWVWARDTLENSAGRVRLTPRRTSSRSPATCGALPIAAEAGQAASPLGEASRRAGSRPESQDWVWDTLENSACQVSLVSRHAHTGSGIASLATRPLIEASRSGSASRGRRARTGARGRPEAIRRTGERDRRRAGGRGGRLSGGRGGWRAAGGRGGQRTGGRGGQRSGGQGGWRAGGRGGLRAGGRGGRHTGA